MRETIFVPLINNEGQNSKISEHFGHAPYFALYDLTKKKLIIKENKLDHANRQKTPVDQIIEIADPSIVFAQGMGSRAINLFTEKNIALKTGPYKILKEVIENIENLDALDNSCGH